MITYATAIPSDAQAIALLHTRSWQQNYRGIMSDKYLDEEAAADRLYQWTKHLQSNSKQQHIIVAKEAEQLCGFARVYLKSDEKWGALLDNLHVAKEWKGQGIGKKLMQLSMDWVREKEPESGLFLWVFESNIAAIKFYESIGGVKADTIIHNNPGGGKAKAIRYIWKNPLI